MKKFKITFIDVAIVLLIAAVAAVALFIFAPAVSNSAETKEVYFTVMATEAEEGISKLVEQGEKVSISFSEEAYATVIGAGEEPCEKYEYFQPKGFYMTHRVKGKSDVKVFLKCDAKVTDTEILSGNLAIRVGEEMPVRGKNYTIKGYVVEIEER